jgi:hypothetical protein
MQAWKLAPHAWPPLCAADAQPWRQLRGSEVPRQSRAHAFAVVTTPWAQVPSAWPQSSAHGVSVGDPVNAPSADPPWQPEMQVWRPARHVSFAERKLVVQPRIHTPSSVGLEFVRQSSLHESFVVRAVWMQAFI